MEKKDLTMYGQCVTALSSIFERAESPDELSELAKTLNEVIPELVRQAVVRFALQEFDKIWKNGKKG